MIKRIVSRPKGQQMGRFSAASAFPKSVARSLRISVSKQTFQALSEGLKARRIIGSAATEESKHNRYLSHQQCPEMKKRPSVQEERF